MSERRGVDVAEEPEAELLLIVMLLFHCIQVCVFAYVFVC